QRRVFSSQQTRHGSRGCGGIENGDDDLPAATEWTRVFWEHGQRSRALKGRIMSAAYHPAHRRGLPRQGLRSSLVALCLACCLLMPISVATQKHPRLYSRTSVNLNSTITENDADALLTFSKNVLRLW